MSPEEFEKVKEWLTAHMKIGIELKDKHVALEWILDGQVLHAGTIPHAELLMNLNVYPAPAVRPGASR